MWAILLIELVFEVLIRPSNYYSLIKSDKAFAPSTARYINRFHLVCESLALALFIPTASCSMAQTCSNSFNMSTSALWSLTSTEDWEAAVGRLALGLTFLRAFGLVRHWKQMWIDFTFEQGKEKRSKSS